MSTRQRVLTDHDRAAQLGRAMAPRPVINPLHLDMPADGSGQAKAGRLLRYLEGEESAVQAGDPHDLDQ